MRKFLGLVVILLSISCTAQDKLANGLYAKINTSKGSILVKLEFEKVPLTVANFVGLAEGKIPNSAKAENTPYFDGISFHRVIKGFVIQGGDPSGTGAGGPGYSFRDEIDPSLKHDRAGTLSMANAGKNTNGSQFFITHSPQPHLDGKHAVFGYVVEGQGTVDLIQQGDLIKSIEIIRKGAAAKAFDAAATFQELR
jgi:peptidylprolyl isomerase